MKITAFIICLLSLSFHSFAEKDSLLHNLSFRTINFKFKSDLKNSGICDLKIPHVFATQEIDLAEAIILSVGVSCMIPLCVDLYNDRKPSEMSWIGVGAYGTCFVTALVYRFGFKGKHKKQEKWDR